MYARKGLTLIEMLVAIAIIGTLTALTLVAVQAARDASRRVQCLGNLRQIALAMSSYLDRVGTLPSAMMRIEGSSRAYCESPFARILPEMDLSAVYNAVNFESHQPPNAIALENQTAASVSIASYLCPADAASFQPGIGPTSYRVNMGSGYQSFPIEMEAGEPGPFVLAEWIAASAILDGLSVTCILSERLRGDGNPLIWTRERDPWFADLQRFKPRPSTNSAVQLCSELPAGLPPHYSNGGETWFLFSYDKTFYNHVTSPNALTPDCGTTNELYGSNGASDSGIYSARSAHAGLVNAATADGAVRSVRSGIATSVWRSLGTRAGHEIISSDSF